MIKVAVLFIMAMISIWVTRILSVQLKIGRIVGTAIAFSFIFSFLLGFFYFR